jgi:hypothetical protein
MKHHASSCEVLMCLKNGMKTERIWRMESMKPHFNSSYTKNLHHLCFSLTIRFLKSPHSSADTQSKPFLKEIIALIALKESKLIR